MKDARPAFRHKTDLEQMHRDIVQASQIAGVPCDKDAVWNTLQAYKDFFSGSAVTFVTNTKPQDKRGLAVRYVELQMPHDPYAIAREAGFITEQKNPLTDLLFELQAKHAILGYGTDLAAAYGFAKIWVFLQRLPPIREVCALSSLPASLTDRVEFFENHGLNHVSLFALDYRHETANIYFMVKRPGLFSPDQIAQMLTGVGLQVPSQEMLEHCARAVTIYYTFDWNSAEIQRACFGTIVPDPSLVPTHLHPLLERYTTQVPFQTEKRIFIYSITPARDGDYIKIENDYTGTMTDLMRGGMEAVP